jgi:hypothetical protein
MIPQDTKECIDEYVKEKYPPGGFLTAVLENNLMEAFRRADQHNIEAMKDIVSYVYNSVPISAHGSPEIVKKWLYGE